MTKEEILTAIDLVCKELLNVDTINKWFSVKERPLTKIIDQVGLDKHYATSIYEVLSNYGLIEKEGSRIGLRYKILTNFIPDAAAVAQKVYQNYMQKIASYGSDITDTRPKQPRHNSMDDLERKAYRKKKTIINDSYSRIPHLGQVVYTLVKGQVTEARITCVRFDDDNKVKVDFSTPMQDSEGNVVKRQDYCLRSVAFSVEELIKKLQSNVIKFPKK